MARSFYSPTISPDSLDFACQALPRVLAPVLVAHERPQPLHRLGNRKQPLNACQVHAGFVDQVLDEAEALELLLRIDAHAADRARRSHQAEALVFPERLRVHVEQPRGHADKVEIVFDRHAFLNR